MRKFAERFFGRALFASILLMLLALAGDLPAEEPEGILFRQLLPALPGDIFTEVELNGEKRSMMIDTGAEMTAVNVSVAKSLKSEGADSVLDSEAHRITAKRYKIRKLMLQSLVQEELPALAIDLALPSSVLGHKIDGVVGTPQLKSGKLFLNYDDGFLEVHSGDWKLRKSESSELDLNFRPTPSFDVMIAGRHGEFIIDTGSYDVIDLESSLFTALVRNGTIEVSNEVGHVFSAGGDNQGRSGWFVKGDLMGKSLKGMSAVSIGGADGQSAVGTGWLCAFNLEIDYPAQKLRFQKRRMPRAPLSTRLMLGGSLIYSDQGARIERLRSDGGGALEKAGLRVGDMIETLNGVAAGDLSMRAVGEIVSAKAGQRVAVDYRRSADGPSVHTLLDLPPPISEWDFAGRDIFEKKAEATKHCP